MKKIYRVHLTQEERARLQEIIKKNKSTSVEVKRSYILLAADENGGHCWNDSKIYDTYGSSLSTIERLRERFVEDGLEVALKGKSRRNHREKLFTGDVEAYLIALRCSTPPAGRSRWTLSLLADKMVVLEYVPHMSHESVRQILKKTK